MALRVNSNLPAEFGARITGKTQEETGKLLRNLASGLRINSAGDDAAGLAISERLSSITKGLDRAELNLQDSASVLQVAEGGVSQISDGLQRVRELTLQASNDTLTDADRALIQTEVDQLVKEIDRQASTTTFNGKPLLDGSFGPSTPFKTQSGADEGETIDTVISQVSSTTLGVNSINVSTRAGAEAALSSIDTAITRVSDQAATLGANVNRINSARDFVGVARENTLSALSEIRDADYGENVTKLALAQLREQSGIAAIGQSNLSSQNVLQLLK